MKTLPIRLDLASEPRIVNGARLLGISRPAFLGCCVTLWAWAYPHTSDGELPHTTDSDIDALAELPGFAAALREVGWLRDGSSGGVCMPRFAKWHAKAKREAGIGWTPMHGFSGITAEDRRRWAATYPGVDIDRCVAQANEWLLSSKHGKKDYRRFLVNWFAREGKGEKPDKWSGREDRILRKRGLK